MAYSGILTENTRISNSTNAEFTLYVNNLPVELNEQGFLEIFNHYGNVIGHFFRPNTIWGYVSYGSSSEAQSAIMDLNNVAPLYLEVSLRREKQPNKTYTAKAPVPNHENRCENKFLIQRTGSEKPMDILNKIEPNVGLPNHTADNNLLSNYPTNPFTYNPYETAEHYAHTNMLWTRGHMNIGQNGKRHVSLGRGYTMYEIPDPDPEILNHISKVYEKRTSGLYEFGNDSLECTIGKCKRCSKITKFACEGCPGVFYCSKNCQEIDWPQHRIECQSVPTLVTMTTNTPKIRNEGLTGNKNLFSLQLPLRRPKQSPSIIGQTKQHINVEDIIKIPTSVNNNDREELRGLNVKSANQCERSQNTKEENISTVQRLNVVKSDKNSIEISDVKKHENNSFQRLQDSFPCSDKNVGHERLENPVNSDRRRQNLTVNDVTKIEAEIAFLKPMFLSKSNFTEVKIILNEGREYWIQKLDDHDKIVDLMTKLQDVAQKAQQKAEIVVGKLYAVKYEDIWHRALVKSLDPLTVHYIDFGNEEVAESTDLRLIPQLEDIKRFATKIRISEKAYEKYKDLGYESELCVKYISIDDNQVINVEVKGEKDKTPIRNSESEVQTPILETQSLIDKSLAVSKTDISKMGITTFKKPQNIVNIASVGELGFLDIHAELRNSVYSVTLLLNDLSSDFGKLLSDLPAVCEQEIVKNLNHRPQVKELICGQRLDGEWFRGYVSSLDKPLKMVIIDEGRVMEVTKTIPCPNDFVNICSFGVTCNIMSTNHKLETGEHYSFKVLARINENEVKIEIETSDKEKIIAIVKSWAPVLEQIGVQYASLKNKSEVCLSSYRNHFHMYVRPLDTASKNHFNHVMQSVAKCAQTASSLNEPPIVGQMVLAHYEDDNYYRAIVTKLQGSEISVVYIDFGNAEITDIKKLKILSDELKQLPSCTTKIILKDVPQDTPMTKEISDYLSQLVGIEETMICSFDGIPSKDGVHLQLKGENFNKIISEMLVPKWKKSDEKNDEKDTTCYTLDDIEFTNLGKVGDITKAFVLCSHDEDDATYSMCPSDNNLITHIFKTMSNQMTEYCNKSEHYIPRDNELCIAFYNDTWYRAACANRSETPTASLIFFIDGGFIKTVAHENLRHMPKDFLTPEALANVCTIKNLDPTNFKNSADAILVRRKIKKLITPNTSYNIEIVDCDKDNTYLVNILDI